MKGTQQEETIETNRVTSKSNACDGIDYIIDRYNDLSLLSTDEVMLLPDEFKEYSSDSFMTKLDTFLNKISLIDKEERNTLIEKIVCTIEMAKPLYDDAHETTEYTSWKSIKEYLLQYIQDRVILLYWI